MRIGEAAAAEVRHRVHFAPDHIVQNPEADILERRADAENVVVRADHPERGVGLHRAAGSFQPFAREFVIGLEARELVPGVIDRIDLGLVGPCEIAAKLQVIGRVCENEIDRSFGKLVQFLDAIAHDDAIVFEPRKIGFGS
jgi:hypothetical protein